MYNSVGVDIDYQRYLRCFMNTGYLSSADVLRERSKLLSGPGFEELDGKLYFCVDGSEKFEFETEFTFEAAEEAAWREKVDAPLDVLYDLACAKVFSLFSTGVLKLRGWRFLTPEEIETLPEDEPARDYEGMYVPLRPQDIRLSLVNWKESEVEDGNGNVQFRGILLSTSDLLACFTEPAICGRPMNVTNFGASLIATGEGKQVIPTAAPRRGRRKKADGMLEKALLAEFRRRQSSDDLPTKKEAVYAEAEAWVRENLGEQVSRSSIQRILVPLWP